MSNNLVKYRLHEVAKDLGLQNKDIADILEGKFEGQKKHMTALPPEELDYVFEQYTKNTALKTLEPYFVAGDAERKKREAEKVAAEKAEKLRAEKAAQAARAEKAAQVAKTEKAEKAVQAAKTEKTEKTERSAEPAQSKPDEKAQAPKPAENPQAPKAPEVKKPKAPAGAMAQPFKKQQKKEPGAHPNVEKTVRVVDTRTSNVNMAKYDERLDALVPQSVKETRTGKQKFKKSGGRPTRGSQRFPQRVETEAEKLKRLELEKARKATLKIMIPDEIVVSELAMRMKKTTSEIVKKLMLLGVMANQNQIVDFDTAALIAEELGIKYEHEQTVTIEEQLIDDSADKEEDLFTRDPVVTVMGHVDHGKTSLLDKIRHTSVTSGEAGGITQHIGAYRVPIKGRNITFIDTPGHAAFTEMRARGANVTDIVVLVVAADDGIMPQTVEAINHSKAAGVSIVVAINKIDKPTANPDRVKQALTEHGLVPEEWGGDVICVPVSALTGQGIEDLLEMLVLTADVLDLKANPSRAGKGTVIEAKLDKGRGPVATLLVQNGTLKTGDTIIAGTAVGRVRAMSDENGNKLNEAGPGAPVEIIGLAEVPAAGDLFYAVDNEKMARELAEQRKTEIRAEANKSKYAVSLDELFTQIKEGEIKELNLLIKADVQGSAEALKASLEKLSNEEVRVSVIHSGVGAISERDIMLASASGAIVIGFNVRPDSVTAANAKAEGVDIRTYRIIYECLEEIEAAMKGMLAPKYREVVLGEAEVRQVYKLSSVGTIAGCMVKSGKITRNSLVRVIRDGVVIAETKVAGLKRFKDDVKEVAEGYECGISVERFADIKEGDLFETYIMEEYRD